MKRLLLIWCLLAPVISFGQAPTADFTANVTQGCAPLVVQFTNTSANTGSGTTWNWTFGNGASSVLQNPSTSFTQPGQYTVTLTATNPGGSSHTKTVTGFIVVKPAPIISWTVSDSAGCAPHTATFTSTTNAGTPGTSSYLWSFGNGNTATQAVTTQNFANPGTYAVSLRVTNADGCIATLSKPAQIVVYAPPTANFSASNTSFCKPGANTVRFTANVSGGQGPYTYNWSFGDGGSAATANPSHTYSGAGPFSVRLVVTDARGCSDTLLRPDYITTAIPQLSFSTATPIGCVGAPLRFSSNSNQPVTAVFWNFGAAASPATSTAASPMPVFNAAGSYPVTLIGTFASGCTDTVVQTVQIAAAPTASFTNSPAAPCNIPASVSYAATASPGSTYEWHFGNGGTSTVSNPTQTFSAYGIYADTLIVTAANGCRSTVIRPASVNISNQITNIYASKKQGCLPLVVQFKDSITTTTGVARPTLYPYAVTSWLWNFRDGSTSTQPSPSHTFTDTGSFMVLVTMTTANGCVIKDSTLIKVGRLPLVSFTMSPLTSCVRQPISFNNTTTGAQTYQWAFGDGGSSSVKNPTYAYSSPGSFTVILSASHNGCTDTARRGPITVNPPSANFVPVYSCDTPLLVRFQDASIGAQTYNWDFGDGTVSTTSNPFHIYTTPGIYTVRLRVSNPLYGCVDSTSRQVNLTRGVVAFTANKTALCPGDSVSFTGTYTGGTAQSWEWYYESPVGWLRDSSKTASMKHTYNNTGTWGVRLVIKDKNGCYDSLVKRNYILVAKPTARFSTSGPVGCLPLTVTFKDSSSDAAGVSIVSRRWDLGNGQNPTASSVSATYATRGNYDVSLIVTNNLGCSDTLLRPGFVKAIKPTAYFQTADTVVCLNTPVSFNNGSTGGNFIPSRWQFGDGDSSNVFLPAHGYQTLGAFTVRLVVTDSLGCKDTLIRPDYIQTTKPHAAFLTSDTQTVCPPPFVVNFTDASLGAVAYQWTYGNGFNATVANGGTSYTAPGVYTATLEITDAEGCKDTAHQTIKVLGYAGGLSYTPISGCTPLEVQFTTNITGVPSIIWDFADGVTLPATGTTITHTYQTPGAYVPKLVVSNGLGCATSSSGADTLKVDAVTANFVSGPACSENPVAFMDSSQGLFSPVIGRQWIFPGNNAAYTVNPSRTLGAAGTYTVQLIATNANGCRDTISKLITVQPLPNIYAGGDTAVCPGNAVTLYATGGLHYSWSPTTNLLNSSAATPTASPYVPTRYLVTGTDSNGCQNTDSVWVRIKERTTGAAQGDTTICAGETVQLLAGGGTSYQWSPTIGLSDAAIANPVARPETTTNYQVIIRDGTCLPDSQYVAIVVNPKPTVTAGPDVTLISGMTAPLAAQSTLAGSFNWTPSAGLSCASCALTEATPEYTTTYVVIGTTEAGCSAKDSVTVFVACDNSQLFVPNSFTPNDDGENDIFYVHANGLKTIRVFRIYNRWGNVLFERRNIAPNDKSAGWDGTHGGEKLPADAFVYTLEAECSTGQIFNYKGDVTLIR